MYYQDQSEQVEEKCGQPYNTIKQQRIMSP